MLRRTSVVVTTIGLPAGQPPKGGLFQGFLENLSVYAPKPGVASFTSR